MIKETATTSVLFIKIDTQEGRDGTKFLLLIIGTGVLGSAISLLQRIEKAANIAPAFTDSVHDAQQISLSMSNMYIASLLLSGAVFALLVDVITTSQLINIFNISASRDNVTPCRDVSVLLKLILPSDNIADVAKLLLFCFLSGFAERLVPDILDDLTKKSLVKQAQ